MRGAREQTGMVLLDRMGRYGGIGCHMLDYLRVGKEDIMEVWGFAVYLLASAVAIATTIFVTSKACEFWYSRKAANHRLMMRIKNLETEVFGNRKEND